MSQTFYCETIDFNSLELWGYSFCNNSYIMLSCTDQLGYQNEDICMVIARMVMHIMHAHCLAASSKIPKSFAAEFQFQKFSLHQWRD